LKIVVVGTLTILVCRKQNAVRMMGLILRNAAAALLLWGCGWQVVLAGMY